MHIKKYPAIFAAFVFTLSIFELYTATPALGALSCSVVASSSCSSPSVIVLRMSSSSNAHAEDPGQSNANYGSSVICCSGVTGLSNSCTNTSVATVVHLSSTTNAHAEEATFSNFSNNICLSVPSGSVTVGYRATDCSGYDTTLGSLASTTNSHVGNGAAYPANEICGSYIYTQSLSFTLSTSTIGFGTLSASNARYATSNLSGTSTATVGHTFTVLTNAPSGYTALIQGATLTSGANTIAAIGGSNTASAPGTKQFGINISASGGSGSVTAPYSGSGFAYAASATTTSQIASESVGDSVATVYSVQYLANVTASAPAASYSTTLTYLVTANF